MSLQDAIEIKRREAALRPNLIQKLGVAAPLLLGALLACALAAPLLSDRPAAGAEASTLEVTVILVIASIVALFWQEHRHRRQIMRLEIELLKLRRDRSPKKAVELP